MLQEVALLRWCDTAAAAAADAAAADAGAAAACVGDASHLSKAENRRVVEGLKDWASEVAAFCFL